MKREKPSSVAEASKHQKTPVIQPAPLKVDMYHTVIVSEDPNHDPGKGYASVPFTIRGSYPDSETCEACGGDGKVEGKTCAKCHGVGKVPVYMACEACGGEGKKKTDRGVMRCSNCGGVGHVPVQVPFEYKTYITRGVEVHNVPDMVLEALRNAVERHYKFVKASPDAQETTMKETKRFAFPFNVLRSYAKPMTEEEIKEAQPK